MEKIDPHHGQVLVLEGRTFHHKSLSKLYRKSKLVNFNFVLSNLQEF